MATEVSRPRRRPITLTLALVLGFALACGVLPDPQTPIASPDPETTAAPVVTATVAPAAPATSSTPASGGAPGTPAAAVDPGPAPPFAEVATTLASYAGKVDGSPEALAVALRAWGMVPEPSPGLAALALAHEVVAADITGDGQEELIVLAANPDSEQPAGEGTLAILSLVGATYRVGYDSASAGDSQGPVALLAVKDVNDDGRDDVAYMSETCGAHTCLADVRVLSYRDGAFAQLAQGVTAAYPDSIALDDQDGDGELEIVIHGNVIGSVGAGPQRPSTLAYRLIEGLYRLAAVEYDPSELIYFRIVDGNIALAQGLVNEAIAVYTEVIQNAALQPSGVFETDEEEQQALRSFARFRLIVAYAMQEEPSTGRELALIRSEGGPFLPAAEAFWAGYAETRSIEAGCTAVTDVALVRPEMLDILNLYGYANPYFAPEDLCRGAGSGLPEPVTEAVDPGSCAGCG